MPDSGAAFDKNNTRYQAMRSATQLFEVYPCLIGISRLIKPGTLDIQHLVSPDHECRIGMARSNPISFCLGQGLGNTFDGHMFRLQTELDFVLVDGGGLDLEIETGLSQQLRADDASRGKNHSHSARLQTVALGVAEFNMHSVTEFLQLLHHRCRGFLSPTAGSQRDQ